MLRHRIPKRNGKMQVGTNAPGHGRTIPAHQDPRIGPSPKILGPRSLRHSGRAATKEELSLKETRSRMNPAIPQHQAACDLGSRQPARSRRVVNRMIPQAARSHHGAPAPRMNPLTRMISSGGRRTMQRTVGATTGETRSNNDTSLFDPSTSPTPECVSTLGRPSTLPRRRARGVLSRTVQCIVAKPTLPYRILSAAICVSSKRTF